ncbi:LPS assembly lipoprotein LptE [Thiohalocapsa sp. ML1]|uniref:LPS-assembly lipoprotein LptE n=1 Tax=Thiohalocapsa sp. ML1 TaxID=1431688 RepID=UPI0020B15BCD|nr:LPS assembly lipoprotein LptE [Thiohalocapsa sp. ML1]
MALEPCCPAPRSLARRRLAAALLALPAVAVLGGCGFQLRGAVDIPPGLSPVAVRGGGLVGRSIESRLIASGVPTTATPTNAGMVIDILADERDSRVVAVDSNGKALAFMLTSRVRFAVLDAQGVPLVEPQRLTLERTFDDNPDAAVLGKEQESDIIYSDMADDAADQVIFRLRAALAQRPGAG